MSLTLDSKPKPQKTRLPENPIRCRIKQIPPTPTERRGKTTGERTPAPNKYNTPEIIGGNGYNKITRAPAYTFGLRTHMSGAKPATTPYARVYNVENLGRKGHYKVTHGTVGTLLEPISGKGKSPGPASYKPKVSVTIKQPPKYSMQPMARPTREPWDMWTPPPNMYWPDIIDKNPPAYSLGPMPRDKKLDTMPGPADHDPNYDYVMKRKPAFTFAEKIETKPFSTPSPNTYCAKKFNYTKPTAPAPSFGIRHSRYLGQPEVYLKPSKLDIVAMSNY